MLKKISVLILVSIVFFQFYSCSKPQSAATLSIEYIAHASFILSSDTTSILIDPFMSRHWIGYSFPENIITDATLIRVCLESLTAIIYY